MIFTNWNQPCLVFSYSKTGPVWLDTKNYSSITYLVTLSEEIDWGRKNGNRIMHNEPPEIMIRWIGECEYSFH